MRDFRTFLLVASIFCGATLITLSFSCGEDDVNIAGVTPEAGPPTAVADPSTPGRDGAPASSCARGGAACSSFSECCSGTCAGQLCTACSAETESCAGDAGTCCVGLTCYFDACQRCAPDGKSCVNGTDCCSQICGNGTCQACHVVGAGCASDTECCPGSTCEAVDGGAPSCQPPQVAAPTFTPAAGSYPRFQRVELTTATPSATIYYKRESSAGSDIIWVMFEPGSPILVDWSMRIRAYALRTGLRPSPTAEAAYTIGAPLEPPAAPQFTVPTSERSNPISVGISSPNAYPVALCYTINGNAPSCSGQGLCAATSLQYESGSPVPLDASPGGTIVLKAVACAQNRPSSAMTEATYTFRVAAPTANPASGAVPSGQAVVFSTTTVTTGAHGASLCYTTDSSAPGCLGDQCANGTRIAGSSGSVTVTQDITYRVVACRSQYSASEERSFTYDVP